MLAHTGIQRRSSALRLASDLVQSSQNPLNSRLPYHHRSLRVSPSPGSQLLLTRVLKLPRFSSGSNSRLCPFLVKALVCAQVISWYFGLTLEIGLLHWDCAIRPRVRFLLELNCSSWNSFCCSAFRLTF